MLIVYLEEMKKAIYNLIINKKQTNITNIPEIVKKRRKCMKKRISRLVTLGISVVMCFSVVGCGADKKSEGDKTARKNGEKTELTIWVREQMEDPITAAVKQYNEKQDEVKVNAVVYPDNELTDQLTLALSSGNVPDLVSLDDILAPYYNSQHALADVTDKFNSLEFKDAFSKGMVELGEYDGKQYAIPFAPDVSVLFYNKEHFRQAGLDPEKGPETWTELVEYSKKLTKDGQYGYTYNGGGGQMFTFVPFIWSNGGDLLSEDGKTCLLDQPEAIEALQLYDDMTNKYKVTPEGVTTYSWSESQDAFLSGKASMTILGNSQLYTFKTEYPDFDFGVSLIPKKDGKEHSSFGGGDLIAIMEQSKNKEAAWDFAEYVLSEEVQVELFAKNGLLPARTDLFDNPYFNEDDKYQVMQKALEVSRASWSEKYNEMNQPIINATQSCLMQKKTAEEAFKTATEEINKIMK